LPKDFRDKLYLMQYSCSIGVASIA